MSARMRRAGRRAAGWAVALSLALIAGLFAWSWGKRHPEDLPWTPLDLTRPVGLFTARKLTALRDDPAMCRALLDRAGVHYRLLPAVAGPEPQCGYAAAIRFTGGGARTVGYFPANLGTACPVAAALAVWEWEVVQPAAQARFGQPVATIEQLGSYNCRRMYGRAEGSWSEHSTANAVDIAAFVLADGTRISVLDNWTGDARKGAFLRDAHRGACRLFATVLGPDYNAAHRNHFHLDQADRGAMGWRSCR